MKQAIVTGSDYLQVMECSTAIYAEIKDATTCRGTAGPYCAEYHRHSSGLYYMLSYTMQEVPFAWFHKCMMLHSKTFSSSGDIIHCREWILDSINAEALDSVQYNVHTLDKLRRYAHFQQAVPIVPGESDRTRQHDPPSCAFHSDSFITPSGGRLILL